MGDSEPVVKVDHQSGVVSVEVDGVDVVTYVAADGARVVQIDTGDDPGQVRVYLNEGRLYDGDPEKDEGPAWVPVVGVAR